MTVGRRLTTPRRSPRRRAAAGFPYLSRELSWIDFNERVLHEARDDRNPILERAKFLAIFADNLDEFFMIRVSGLREQAATNPLRVSSDGRTPGEQLAEVRTRVDATIAEHARICAEVLGLLAEQGVSVLDYADVPEHHARLRQRFEEEIFPVLTPLAVDPGHPFPYISTLTLSLAIGIRDPETGERRFARVKVPPALPRLVPIGPSAFVLVEQIIAANLDLLFPGMEIEESHLFRVTRDADFEIEEDEASDLLEAIEAELRRRRFGEAVRLEVERTMPAATRETLLVGIRLPAEACHEVSGMLDLTALWALHQLDRPDLKDPPWTPVIPARLAPLGDDEPADVFSAIRQGDILVHHPYESFGGTVERFVEQAVDDPDVLTIKQTLYRTSGDSPIVHDLIRAAEAGKQVVVMVEIKARFDEENNIIWARRLEEAGAHVVYGLAGLKTHSKTCLVVRREGETLRRYVHIGTGNYNPKTARIYVDLGLLTCRPEIGADVTDLFNFLTGLSRQRSFRRLLVAPMTLRTRLAELIEREIGHAESGRPSRIVMKVNAIVDPAIIELLYRASRAGVEIDLIVRGTCSLVPGLEGVSDRIRVRSIVGEFLEHSRIIMFLNGGQEEWYIGSADIMERNLDRRVEAVTPVEDLEARLRLAEIIETLLRDDRRSWQLEPSGRWRRTEEIQACEGTIDTFEHLKRVALAANEEEEEPVPRRVRAGRGSMDPRV